MPSFTLVLSSAPGAHVIAPKTVATARDLLAAHGAIEDRWLAEGEAWEALFDFDDEDSAGAARKIALEVLGSLPVDVNAVPGNAEQRRKGLLVADMESTIIEQELLDEIARRAGLGDGIAAITARAMRGEIEFEAALKERVALLAGLDARILDEAYQRVTFMPGAGTLVRTMKKHGATCALVSGGFTVFTERIATHLGFDEHQANVLEIEKGRLTGRVMEPILGRQAKLHALRRIARERGIDIAQTLAVGDGANDLDMIREAGLGVAFRAKPIVAAEARASIVHGDLTALLYLQGFRKSEFAG